MTLKERQEKTRRMQVALATANENIALAKALANELQVEFEILGRKYEPLKVVEQGGKFDHEAPLVDSWEESFSDVEWNASGGGVPC